MGMHLGHGDIQVLPSSRCASPPQGDQRAERGVGRTQLESLVARHVDGRAFNLALNVYGAAQRGDGDVRAHKVTVGPRAAVGCDGCDDDAGIYCGEIVIAQAARFHLAGVAGFQHHIGSFGQLKELFSIRCRIQIERDSALIRIEVDEEEAAVRARLAMRERGHTPRRATGQRLNEDDIRAKIGKDAAARLPLRPCQVQHGQPVKCARSAVSACPIGHGFLISWACLVTLRIGAVR